MPTTLPLSLPDLAKECNLPSPKKTTTSQGSSPEFPVTQKIIREACKTLEGRIQAAGVDIHPTEFIALMLGLSRATVYRYFRGTHQLGVDHAATLQSYLKTINAR